MDDEFDNILDSYLLYEDILLGRCDPPAVGVEALAMLYRFYEFLGRGRRLKDLRAVVMAAAPGERCPLCGIGRPSTIDHHLPRSSNQVFSIFIENLVPACKDCNHAKGSRGGRGSARLFHPYVDRFPDKAFLEAEVEVYSGVVVINFSLRRPRPFPSELYEAITNHFTELDLDDRFSAEAIEEVTSNIETLENYWLSGGSTNVRRWLTAEEASAQRHRGRNHWRTALYRGLGRSNDFCEGGFLSLDSTL